MIEGKLEQAKRTVQVWADLGKGEEGFEWQYESLTNQADRDAATALAGWWFTHPLNATA
jgi:hypothetical protein